LKKRSSHRLAFCDLFLVLLLFLVTPGELHETDEGLEELALDDEEESGEESEVNDLEKNE